MAHGPDWGTVLRIAIILEGQTEKAFLPYLKRFLDAHSMGRTVTLDPVPRNGLLPQGEKLHRLVRSLLDNGPKPADHVITLTDVYTGSQPPRFSTGSDARALMREWVGNESRFHPHAAQHDFEAWLLPYWERIQLLSGTNRKQPNQAPEKINHLKPPSVLLKDVFRTGGKGLRYVKTRDVRRILDGQDLLIAANACPELKSFLNTLLTLCSAEPIP